MLTTDTTSDTAMQQQLAIVVVCVDDGIHRAMAGGNLQYPEASFHFILHESRRTFIPLVGIFVKNGRVMFVRVFAAFGHQTH